MSTVDSEADGNPLFSGEMRSFFDKITPKQGKPSNICSCPSSTLAHRVTVECLVREVRIILKR
jgi:hypothetical protein